MLHELCVCCPQSDFDHSLLVSLLSLFPFSLGLPSLFVYHTLQQHTIFCLSIPCSFCGMRVQVQEGPPAPAPRSAKQGSAVLPHSAVNRWQLAGRATRLGCSNLTCSSWLAPGLLCLSLVTGLPFACLQLWPLPIRDCLLQARACSPGLLQICC